MKLNIYANQNEIEKTFEVDNYDLMWGTVEDLFAILDEIKDPNDNMQVFGVIQRNRRKLNEFLMDIFSADGLTEDDLRKVKAKELIPLFVDLFTYTVQSFGDSKN